MFDVKSRRFDTSFGLRVSLFDCRCKLYTLTEVTTISLHLIFINRENAHLPVFGRVTSGMEVVMAIEGVETDDLDRPLSEVKILSVDVS